jgi:hypothetical protein
MDELPNGLAALIADARVAHDPSAAELRRLGAGLSAVIPGFAPVALLAAGVAHGATDAAVQGAVQGASLKAAWLGSAAAAKVVGVLMTVAVAGAAVTVQQLASHAERPARPASALHPSTPTPTPAEVVPSPASAATEPPVPVVPDLAQAVVPQPPRTTPGRAPVRTPKPDAPAALSSSEELSLIEGALGALHRQDPVLAERYLRTHETRFRDGQLARERTGLLLTALCQQGRATEVEADKARFLQENAGSPIAARVARTCP